MSVGDWDPMKAQVVTPPLFSTAPHDPPIEEPDRPTLRDQFAMAALTGIVMDDNGTLVPRRIALAAYDIADAMMEARK